MNENGKMKATQIGITLSVEEFNEMVKLIPKIQDSIAQYKLQDIGPSPPSPLPILPLPLIDPFLQNILTHLIPNQKFKRYHQDLAADELRSKVFKEISLHSRNMQSRVLEYLIFAVYLPDLD